jgi:hypothetical protein
MRMSRSRRERRDQEGKDGGSVDLDVDGRKGSVSE